MIQVAVNGAQGKMGRLAVATIEAAPDMTLVAAWGRSDDLPSSLAVCQPDVMIDFTLPDCVFKNTQLAIEHGSRPVVGASGLSSDEIARLQSDCLAHSLGGLIAPNFSISAILMMQMAQQAARYFPHAEIIEMHHPNKIDAPSGTAIATAERMEGMSPAVSGNHPAPHCVSGVPIHSLRMPGLFAHQQVIFSREGERLTLQQDCSDREAMMPGVLMAIRFVMQASELHYGLDAALIESSR